MKKPILWKRFLGFVLAMVAAFFVLSLMRGKPLTWQAYAFVIGLSVVIAGLGFGLHLIVRSSSKAERAVPWIGLLLSISSVLLWTFDVIFWGNKITLRNAYYPILFSYLIYVFYKLLKKNKTKK